MRDNSILEELATLRAENERLAAELQYLSEHGSTETVRLQKEFKLTPLESRIVHCLMDGRLHDRYYLQERCSIGGNDPNIVSVMISKIRKKFPPGTISTIWGHGFQLERPDLLRRGA